MRPRVVMVLAFMIAAVAVGFTGARLTYLPAPHPPAHATLPPTLASYLGVFEPGSPPSYQPIEQFADSIGREPNLDEYYSGWAEPFPTSFAQMIHRHGVIPFVQIDPTDASVPGIAAGFYDVYLRLYADSVADYGHQVLIGFGHEMNGRRYSWGYTHMQASTFVAAWRHIVTVFRDEGAYNVTWLWSVQADSPGTDPDIAEWWPGLKYVSWVGIDGYYYRPSDTFRSVFGTTIDQVRAFTNKPVILSETAVGPRAGQLDKIQDLFAGMRAYRTLGLVWFDEDQHQGIYHQDWRIEGNVVAETAFRLGLADLTLVTTDSLP